jgi:hypothetical protein
MRYGRGLNAGIVHPVLVGLDRAQHRAERRTEDPLRNEEADDQNDGAEVEAP